MTKSKKTPAVHVSRRRLLKTSALAGGALAAGRLSYVRPELQTFLGGGDAYAQQTSFYTIECFGDPEVSPGPANQVCNDSAIVNIVASVSPIPPVGTEIQCDPTTDDPQNPTGFVAIGETDAAGFTSVSGLDLELHFPNPPIADGSTLTLTFKFVDQATYGTEICELFFDVVDCVG